MKTHLAAFAVSTICLLVACSDDGTGSTGKGGSGAAADGGSGGSGSGGSGTAGATGRRRDRDGPAGRGAARPALLA
jgi:hypothetical protein